MRALADGVTGSAKQPARRLEPSLFWWWPSHPVVKDFLDRWPSQHLVETQPDRGTFGRNRPGGGFLEPRWSRSQHMRSRSGTKGMALVGGLGLAMSLGGTVAAARHPSWDKQGPSILQCGVRTSDAAPGLSTRCRTRMKSHGHGPDPQTHDKETDVEGPRSRPGRPTAPMPGKGSSPAAAS